MIYYGLWKERGNSSSSDWSQCCFWYGWSHHLNWPTTWIIWYGDKALRWFQSYLDNRYCKVKIGKEYSERKSLNFSVPQGSCAGPVLYLSYATSISDVVSRGIWGRRPKTNKPKWVCQWSCNESHLHQH